jgi:hypothetical protein
MRLPKPGERFVVVAGPHAGATGTAIDYLSPGWERIYKTHVPPPIGGPMMWCAMDDLEPSPPLPIGFFGLPSPPSGAYASPQRHLMHIDPDQATRDERHDDAEQTPREVEA